MLRKTGCLILSLLLVLSLLAGCAQLTTQNVALKMWHWAGNKEAVYKTAIEEYQKLNPSVKIEQRLIPLASYRQTLTAAQVGNEAPDIFHAEPFADVASHLKNKQIIELTPYFDAEWQKAFYPSTLEAFKIGGKFYNVSAATNNMQILYNVDAFAKAGISAPLKTIDELLDAVKKLEAAGAGRVSFRGGDPVQMSHWFTVYSRQLYAEKFKAADEGDGSFDAPEFVELFTRLEKFFKGAFAPGVAGFQEDPARILFSSGKASMYVTGNWAVRSIMNEKPAFKVGVMPIPALTAAAQPTAFGSLAGTWVVSSQSKSQKEAVAFLKWYTLNYQDDLVRAIGLCPAGPPGEAGISAAPEIAQQLMKMQGQAISRDNFNQKARDAAGAALQGLVIGDLKPADVAKKIQEAKLK
jgi:raffinose/stachyose/melibiose transport system substrate-binding protein